MKGYGDKVKVAIMGEASSFMLDAIKKGLKEVALEGESMPLTEKSIKSLWGEEVTILLMMDETTAFDNAHLEKLATLCKAEKKTLFLMGYAHQVAAFSNILTEEIVTDVFKRPVNTREVVERIGAETKTVRERMRKKTILVVDDAGEILHAIKAMLEPRYKVAMANSGKQALAYLEMNKPDLILLDYEMPVMDGPATLKKIKENFKTARIPVFFLTSKQDAESVQNAIALNPKGYIVKTTPRVQIISRIDGFFDSLG